MHIHAGQVQVAETSQVVGQIAGAKSYQAAVHICRGPHTHTAAVGQAEDISSGGVPGTLAERCANLVIKSFKQNLQFWRYKLQTEEGEVNKLQQNWIRSN